MISGSPRGPRAIAAALLFPCWLGERRHLCARPRQARRVDHLASRESRSAFSPTRAIPKRIARRIARSGRPNARARFCPKSMRCKAGKPTAGRHRCSARRAGTTIASSATPTTTTSTRRATPSSPRSRGVDDASTLSCTWLTAPRGTPNSPRGDAITQPCSEQARFVVPYPGGMIISVEIGGREVAKDRRQGSRHSDRRHGRQLRVGRRQSGCCGRVLARANRRLQHDREFYSGLDGYPARIGPWRNIGDKTVHQGKCPLARSGVPSLALFRADADGAAARDRRSASCRDVRRRVVRGCRSHRRPVPSLQGQRMGAESAALFADFSRRRSPVRNHTKRKRWIFPRPITSMARFPS